VKPGALQPVQLVLSCEHASNRLPARYAHLGLRPRVLASHIAWDPGAASVARFCARRLGCPYHEGRYSRLLIDLNRSLHHPKLIPARSFGVTVPGNSSLTRTEREDRIAQFYRPYRETLLDDIRTIIGSHGLCLHVSLHSFTPRLGRIVRRADIGLLYDPARDLEREIALALAAELRHDGLHTRRNYPYRGTSDGVTAFCRKLFPPSRYLGIELELNQQLLPPATRRRPPSDAVATAVQQLFGMAGR
jgi:predicted N-formylglutamate amidohydrolase